MKFRAIGVLALGSVLALGPGSQAHSRSSMAAVAECAGEACMPRGDAQTGRVGAGFQRTLATNGEAKIWRTSRYRDNMDWVIDRRVNDMFSPIGELESVEDVTDKEGHSLHKYGTATLISPCYIITNHHVAFRGDLERWPGKDYSMKFRIGVGPTPDVAFLGNTIATPIAWGSRGAVNTNDWAIMKLKTCVGARPDVGWIEVSNKSPEQLVGADIVVAGYAGDRQRGNMSIAVGKAHSINPANGFLRHSASAVGGESGGAVLIREDGIWKIVGMHTLEFADKEDNTNMFNTYSDRHENEFIWIGNILNRPDIKEMLDQDKANYGNKNPAESRLTRPIPSRPTM